MKQSKSVLLIEDDTEDQAFFIEAISEIENASLYDVARNGKEALKLLQHSLILPDLIFSDINMPVMNGIECLAEIKMNPRTKNIPVIILSSSVAHSAVACSLGAKAFIKKPDNFNLLRDQIVKIINEDFIVATHFPVPVFLPLNTAA